MNKETFNYCRPGLITMDDYDYDYEYILQKV